MMVMCKAFGKDFGVSITGQHEEELFSMLNQKTQSDEVEIGVDWDTTTSAAVYLEDDLTKSMPLT
jgi:hypothetical protein